MEKRHLPKWDRSNHGCKNLMIHDTYFVLFTQLSGWTILIIGWSESVHELPESCKLHWKLWTA